jgi:hypothetical protein
MLPSAQYSLGKLLVVVVLLLSGGACMLRAVNQPLFPSSKSETATYK